jgi:hypothetical protein
LKRGVSEVERKSAANFEGWRLINSCKYIPEIRV